MQKQEKNIITFRDLGLIDYKDAWDLQLKTLNTVVKEKLESGNDISPKGQVVFKSKQTQGGTIRLKANRLAPGLYLAKTKNGHFEVVKKLVILP